MFPKAQDENLLLLDVTKMSSHVLWVVEEMQMEAMARVRARKIVYEERVREHEQAHRTKAKTGSCVD